MDFRMHVLFIFSLSVLCLHAKTIADLDNEAQLIGNSYTKVIVEHSTVTSLVPSSCIQVDPTLLPCRNVRYLSFPSITSFSLSENERLEGNFGVEARVEPSSLYVTPLSWGEYFGVYAPTVTVTSTQLYTTTIQNPGIVVTFSVTGCRPLEMPKDIDQCPPVEPGPITIEEIIPTTTIPSNQLASTDVFDTAALYRQPQVMKQESSAVQYVESSTEHIINISEIIQATEKLPV